MDTLLIANRGEIVLRIARTAKAMGLRTVGVYTDADRGSPAVAAVDVAIRLPSLTVADTYLNPTALVEAANRTGADTIHPGYGFLAENAEFASRVIDAGLTWVGPRPEHITAMGDKLRARTIAATAGVPVLPSASLDELDELEELEYPLLVKASSGGGGKGMRLVASGNELAAAVAEASGEAERNFGDGTVYLERFVPRARHIEVQVFGDRHGNVVHLFERECSIQRRFQKIIEEGPAPGIDDGLRRHLCDAAVGLARHLRYEGAGTVEFVVGGGEFFFIEMNTRLQVEHPVTEALTGLDLVAWQLRVAAGEELPCMQDEIAVEGHAIEARLYAENPAAGWAAGTGMVYRYRHGEALRYEEAVGTGVEITAYYDPMIAKVISHAATRREAGRLLARELAAIEIHGPATNRDFLVAVLRSDAFLAAETTTSFIDDHPDLLDARPESDVRESHLAAALWSRVKANRVADMLWGFAPAGWRNGPSQWSEVRFDGEIVSYVAVGSRNGSGRLKLRCGESVIVATITGEGPYFIEIDGITRHCSVHRVNEVFWVNSADGQSSFVESPRFVVPDAFVAGRGPTAPMPGTVISVLVEPGDQVDEHTDLLVMEAMKMEHRVRALGAATVAEVLVVVGDQVDAGQLLVRLESL